MFIQGRLQLEIGLNAKGAFAAFGAAIIDLASKHGVLPGGKIKTFAYSAQKHDQSTRQTIPFVGGKLQDHAP